MGVGDLCDVRRGPARDWFSRTTAAHHVMARVAATATLFACAMTIAGTHQRTALTPAGITIATVVYVSFAVIAIMRWPPWLPVAVTTTGAVASMAAGTPDVLIGPALLVSMLVFSLRSERTPVIAGTAAVIGVLLIGHLVFSLHAKTGWSDLAVVPWTAVAAAIGQAVRAKRAHQAMLEERARRTEEGRELQARRRISEERLRIARELHDAVGHHVALISVQAGAMGYLLDTDLDKARESLAHIQRASESALEELRLTVGLLRQPGDSKPTHGLRAGQARRADRVLRGHRPAGHLRRDGPGQAAARGGRPDRLPGDPGVPDPRTRPSTRPGPRRWSVSPSGPGCWRWRWRTTGRSPPGTPRAAEGHGIIGMRERAATVGGWLTAGPRGGGGFRVLAELPPRPGHGLGPGLDDAASVARLGLAGSVGRGGVAQSGCCSPMTRNWSAPGCG